MFYSCFEWYFGKFILKHLSDTLLFREFNPFFIAKGIKGVISNEAFLLQRRMSTKIKMADRLKGTERNVW